jgi:hypothetical protein
MSALVHGLLPVSISCVVMLVACKRSREGTAESDRSGSTTVTGARILIPNDVALGHIVEARCHREQVCNRIGLDRLYATSDLCVERIKADLQNHLSPQECPNGVDRLAFEGCLTAIANENCENPIDLVRRDVRCSVGKLCPKNERKP